MKQEILKSFQQEYEKTTHKKRLDSHKLQIDDLEQNYISFYSKISNVKLEKDICKQFEACDIESLMILENFFGE